MDMQRVEGEVLHRDVPGVDLARILDALTQVGTPFPASAALEVGAAIFDALDFATRAGDGDGGIHGVIPRDITPERVRLTADGDLEILGFDIARFSQPAQASDPDGHLSADRSPIEVIGSATATVVELLLGRSLGRIPAGPDRRQAFVGESLERARLRIVAAPEVVDQVIDALDRGLRADPAERPAARQLSDELEQLARQVDGPSLTEFARWVLPLVDGPGERRSAPEAGIPIEDADTTAEMDLSIEDTDTTAEIGLGTGEREVIANGLVADQVNTRSDAEIGFFLGEPEPEPESELRVSRRDRILPLVAVVAGVGSALALGAVAVIGLVGFGDDVARWLQARVSPDAGLSPSVEAPVGAMALAAPSEASPAAEPPPSLASVLTPEPSASPAPAPARSPSVAEPPPPAPAGARIDELTASAEGAERIRVRCGDVSAAGESSVRLEGVPAGLCTFEVDWSGQTHRMGMPIEEPRSVRCELLDGVLRCS